MASSYAIHQPKDKYDVFLSFRGIDTRQTFTSHLEKALSGKKIETYIDYRLESGDEIAPALLKAIEESKISVIIFSENYASSRWCLDELVHILECNEKYGRHVIPVFYGILASVVRHQTGSYKLEERFKDRRIDRERQLKWKGALRKAANISGFDSNATTVRDDSDLIEQIVEYIFQKLIYVASSISKGLVGVERRIQKIESLLRIVPQDDCVRCVGIWGMGGVGKTTLADALYHRLSSQFDSCCFLADVRENSWADGKVSQRKLKDLRNKLLRKLLGNESIDIQSKTIDYTTAMQLSRRKVLVVLDDVNDLSQLEMLAGCDVRFGSGSRIIITTRDMQKLRQTKVGDNHDVEIYEVEKLNGGEAHQLLQLNASRGISSAADSTEVLRKVVDYAAGIPLALNTWGSLVHKGLWDDVKKSLNEDMESVYKVCYDVLRTNEKEIFLDIACFYKGMEINDAKRYLDVCSSSVDSGINVLVDMSLIALKYNRLWMHDVIQEMGREIVRKQCPEEPGRRTRLYAIEDIRHVLENSTGTATIQTISIRADNYSTYEMNITPEAFREMHNLRILEANSSNLQLPQGLESLPQALRYLSWFSYPLKSLPSKFSPRFLVELYMPRNNLQTLWNKGQNPWNLKKIDLSASTNLVDVSDLSTCLNIVSINLEGCYKLVEVPSYFENFHKLTYLNLRGCPRLKSLPAVIPSNMEFLLLGAHRPQCSELPSSIWSLEKLVALDLEGFYRVNNVPSTWRLYSLKSLDFSETSIEGLPPSIECLSRVVSITLQNCKRLVSLPTNICKLKSLKELDLSGCSSFKFFPEILESMECLEDLNLCGTGITKLHKSIGTLDGLKELKLSKCRSLVSVPDSIYKINLVGDFSLVDCDKLEKLPLSSSVIFWPLISDLNLRGCTSLEEIPDGLMISLTSLTSLFISNCERLQSLKELPCRLRILDIDCCTNLRLVSFSMTAATPGLHHIRDAAFHEVKYLFRSCKNLEENAKSNITDNAKMRVATAYSKHKQINHDFKNGSWGDRYYSACYSVAIVYSGNEIPPWFRYQTEGSSISIKIPVHPHTNKSFWQICLCAVLTIDEDEDEDEDWFRYIQEYNAPRCKSNLTSNNGYSSQFNVDIPDISVERKGKLDCIALDQSQVFVWYCRDWSNHLSTASEASFEFYLDPKNRSPREVDRIKVKRCGVCLVNSRGQDVVAVDQDVGEPKPEQVISRKRSRDEYEASGSATVTEF